MKKCVLSVAVAAVLTGAMVLGLASVASAASTWDGGGGDGLWATAANWSPNGVPSTVETWVSRAGAVSFTGATPTQSGFVRVGYEAQGGWNGGALPSPSTVVTMTGGSITGGLSVSRDATFELKAGSLSFTNHLVVGQDGGRDLGVAKFILEGGSVSTANLYMQNGAPAGVGMLDRW